MGVAIEKSLQEEISGVLLRIKTVQAEIQDLENQKIMLLKFRAIRRAHEKIRLSAKLSKRRDQLLLWRIVYRFL